jgi:acid stress-induced BolA-like protein IbaG/YrbA
MIKSINEKKQKQIEIDLTGPDGNAFALMAYASRFAKQLGLDKEAIIKDMMSSDYEHLLQVFDEHFGDYVILYR